MQLNGKLILLIFSLFILISGKNIRRIYNGCTDSRCSQICVTKVENGKACNIGHCFPDGKFCYCQWIRRHITYNCDNMLFTK